MPITIGGYKGPTDPSLEKVGGQILVFVIVMFVFVLLLLVSLLLLLLLVLFLCSCHGYCHCYRYCDRFRVDTGTTRHVQKPTHSPVTDSNRVSSSWVGASTSSLSGATPCRKSDRRGKCGTLRLATLWRGHLVRDNIQTNALPLLGLVLSVSHEPTPNLDVVQTVASLPSCTLHQGVDSGRTCLATIPDKSSNWQYSKRALESHSLRSVLGFSFLFLNVRNFEHQSRPPSA